MIFMVYDMAWTWDVLNEWDRADYFNNAGTQARPGAAAAPERRTGAGHRTRNFFLIFNLVQLLLVCSRNRVYRADHTMRLKPPCVSIAFYISSYIQMHGYSSIISTI